MTTKVFNLFNRAPARPTGLPRRMLLGIGLLSAAAVLAEHGFVIESAATYWIQLIEFLLAGAYIADRVLMLVRGPRHREIVRQRQFEFAVLLLFAILASSLFFSPPAAAAAARFFHTQEPWRLGIHLCKLFLLANVLVQMLRLWQRLLFRGARPEWILAGSYALLILAGTLLLQLPRASAIADLPIGLLDALFTATSASCVTGLGVRDTGTEFTSLGQVIVLGLIQVGGLGIMTFVAFLAVTSAESLPVPQMLAFRQMVGARTPAVLKRQVWTIVVFTVLVEAAGAACLYACLPPDQDRLVKFGWSVFHSVSAFCNAGFSFSAQSLAQLQSHVGAMLTFMALIVLGGLGFLVVTDILGLQVSRLPIIRQIPWVRRYNQRVPVYRLPVQTRLSVLVTAILFAVGLAGFWALEAGHVLADKPVLTQLLTSAFHSISPRTAGFATVPIDQLQTATLLLIMALMVIGACPISTGGGIKTVTFAVLLVALRSLMTGRDRVEIYGRALPQRVLLAALAVVVLYVIIAGLGLFALALYDPQLPLRSEMFEVVSALSTVGLSTGITAQLSPASQLVLCLLMFVGRVGPISMVLAVVRIPRPVRYQFPEEDLVVG
ncbi:MAG: ATPase [Verrucomicrobia bacterium]|jgi:potassium uptake TrkH family protein|nr:ATPase [Verrucomicrobiota bacterium]OQC62666.1 MAG: Ktr system potassium uptake protein B [Verrucomicrobia bacterium ADurb.Bin006]NMD21518.1 ATPase [Verrucomicrobiota bacterium]HOA61787.1 potassium transporter TrkG [Verrucomicrobiota bacterium]HOF46751.1 potassium transporter TrkG [Verrucomicrobiota bacterium]